LNGTEFKEESFIGEVNPLGEGLTIKYGADTLLGGIQITLAYLQETFGEKQPKFYPTDKQSDIDKFMLWY